MGKIPPQVKQLINENKVGYQGFEAKTPIATDMFIPNHSGITGSQQAKNQLDTRYLSRFLVSGGQSGNITGNAYMNIGSALMGAGEGVVMVRSGSITGISGNATILIPDEAVSGFFQVRKNGTAVFQVSFNNTSEGISSANATQAIDTDTFAAGDIVSLTVECGSATLSKVFISAELTYH